MTAVRARLGSGWSRLALASWRVRWRLAAMVVVPAMTAAVLGGLTIYQDTSGWLANGRRTMRGSRRRWH